MTCEGRQECGKPAESIKKLKGEDENRGEKKKVEKGGKAMGSRDGLKKVRTRGKKELQVEGRIREGKE